MDQFIGKYSIQKTLRFELIPVNEKLERIKGFKNEKLRNVIEKDEERAAHYKKMKGYLDEYYRYFIDEVLKVKIITKSEIQNAYDEYMNYRDKKNDKTYNLTRNRLRKKISVAFKTNAIKFNLDKDFSNLINSSGSGEKTVKPLLWRWYHERLENGSITQNEFNDFEIIINSFQKFTTYFTGFRENRENMFAHDEQKTAIPYRIVHENMEKYFDNCQRYEAIKKNHPDLYKQLNKHKEYFKPSEYTDFFNQTGIDDYNTVIGRKSDDQNGEGINQTISIYRQKNGIKNYSLPLMSQLYKQILSIDDRIVFDSIASYEDLFNTIDTFYSGLMQSRSLLSIKDLIVMTCSDNDAIHGIYIKRDSLSAISQTVYSDWGFIEMALKKHAEKAYPKQKERDAWLRNDVFPVSVIQNAIEEFAGGADYVTGSENGFDRVVKTGENRLKDYFVSFGGFNSNGSDERDFIERIDMRHDEYVHVRDQFDSEGKIDGDRSLPRDDGYMGGRGFQQIEKIKGFLDSIMDLVHFIRPFYLYYKGKMIPVPDKNPEFYGEFDFLYDELKGIIDVFNKTRNYITKKNYSVGKFKINFESPTFLLGWDVTKETSNHGVILMKDGRHFLGIMDEKSSGIFDYIVNEDDSDRIKQKKQQKNSEITAVDGDDYFEKMEYKLLPDPSKMLPKVFFAEKNIAYYKPSDVVLRIKKEKRYTKSENDRKSLDEWIDFCKRSIERHPEWGKYFKFQFSKTEDYPDVSYFYKEVSDQGYNIDFKRIKRRYIDDKILNGELFLFEIYNKDFSPHSKGKPNLHTSYWRLAFCKENLDDLVIKLNGEAEVFFRKSSIDHIVTHPKNHDIPNKNPLNTKRHSRFDYDIIKDRRYSKDKFFFHCPISINFRSVKVQQRSFNDEVNAYLNGNKDVNIIGIDRGERHLLYYTVINRNGSIIEQGSFNRLSSGYDTGSGLVEKTTDYHALLNEKERQRDEARKSWSTIENIKELKSGYLSHIVHKLAALMVKHNAIIALEDLNTGFKRGRMKIEKQVYQKFEKALIDKLNYLVFKDRAYGYSGSYLSGYQLTAPFVSFDKLGKQSGFLFYVSPSYTSRIDPVTGFVNRLNPRFHNIKDSQGFFNSFDSIKYNSDKNYFEFTYDEANFNKNGDREGRRTKWTLCTHGKERHYYSREKGYVCYNVTESLKLHFDKHDIKYAGVDNIKDPVASYDGNGQSKFYEYLTFLLGLVLKIRYTYKTSNDELDYILSPVADPAGAFFDSRKADPSLPGNADANGAYHIALKGLMTLERIEEDKNLFIKNEEWFEFARKRCRE